MKAKEYLKMKYDEYHVISVMELLDYKSIYSLMDEFDVYKNKELINWVKDKLLKHEKSAENVKWNNDGLYSSHMNKAEVFKQILEKLK